MSAFPVLKTGAVAQYPAGRTMEHSTSVQVFVDGSEQRFREFGSAARRWVIRLDLLDEAEMAAMEDFMIAQQGQAGSFSFTDPWDGTAYPDCSFEADAIPLEWQDLMRGHTTVVVRENRS